MMYPQIVQNQKNLLLCGLEHMTQERNQMLLIHGVLIQHITQFPLTAQGGNHIYPLFFCRYRQNGWLSLWRKAALIIFTIADTCLVCPIYGCIFLPGPLGYGRVFFPLPPLDTRGVLLPGTFYRTLAAQPPAPHIIRCAPFRHPFLICFPHIRTDLLQRPKIPRHPKFFWLPVHYRLPYFCFFFGKKNIVSTT